MRGQILGYSNGSGVIQTDSGERFAFSEINWRDEEPPTRGASVDFVDRDGLADEIYFALGVKRPTAAAARPMPADRPLLQDTAALAEDLRDKFRETTARDDALGDFVNRLRASPQIVLAALILLAAFMMTFATFGIENDALRRVGVFGTDTEVSLLDLPDEAALIREHFAGEVEKLDKQLNDLRSIGVDQFGGQAFAAEQRAKLTKIVKADKQTLTLYSFAPAIWLVPLLAICVIALGWLRYAAVKLVGVLLGFAAVGAAVYLYALRRMFVATIEAALSDNVNLLIATRRAANRAIQLDTGGWLIVACGIACIILGVVRVKRAAA